ncbi:MAG: hypothetical protein ABIN48_00890 [Ginsengibacter sp.]
MFYIYFICLLILICWLNTRISFFKKTGLGANLLVSLFLIRIIVAVGAYYFILHFYPDSDSFFYHQYGIKEYQLLFSDPKEYFRNLFIDGYNSGYSGLFATKNSFWNNLGTNLLITLLSLFNIISLKSLLINTLLFNSLIFIGSIALFRVCISLFPKEKSALIAVIFLLPSALIFSSIIHKDGLILLLLSLLIYQLFFWIRDQKKKVRLLYAFIFLILIFFIRPFILIVLLPALVAYLISEHSRFRALPVFVITYAISTILFFLSPNISPKLNLPELVSKRQAAFEEISILGSSTIDTHILEPSFISFVKNLPQALNHVLLRPYLFEGDNILFIPFAIEILLYICLFLLFLFFRKKNVEVPSLLYFFIFFSATMFVVIGYTIPIIGAFVRYRSIYFIFLLIPLLVSIDWGRFKRKIKLK